MIGKAADRTVPARSVTPKYPVLAAAFKGLHEPSRHLMLLAQGLNRAIVGEQEADGTDKCGTYPFDIMSA